MKISRKLGSVLVAMVLGTGAMNAMAQQASAPAAQSQGVLSGALTVGIPAGFEGSDLPENPGAPAANDKLVVMNAYSAQKDAAGHEALTKALAGQLSAR